MSLVLIEKVRIFGENRKSRVLNFYSKIHNLSDL
jgi:hypothetical protein